MIHWMIHSAGNREMHNWECGGSQNGKLHNLNNKFCMIYIFLKRWQVFLCVR